MNSTGTINTSHIVEYIESCESYENLDNKFIVKVKSSSLDDVIILFKEANFERFIREAFNCFIVCVEFEKNEEEEDDVDDKYTAVRLEGTFKADRLIILQLNGNLWIKKCLQRKFFNMKSPKMRKYHKLLEDINYGDDFLSSQLRLQCAIDWIKPEMEDFEIKIIKLFKFDNQKEVDKKLFNKALRQKCSFEVIQSMINFHRNPDGKSNGMNKYEVDALFWAKGIKVFDDEVIENFKQDLKIEDKEKITDEIQKFHGNQKSLLQHLCSRSRIALNTEDTEVETLQIIVGFYRRLIDLNVDSVTDLLKIVDHKLLLIFDFDSNSIERSYLMGSRHNRGIFDQDRVKIYIGAKNSNDPSSLGYITREWEIIGILIHEIFHYVNFKVFNNNCKPYYIDDKNIKEYEVIVNEYKNWTNHHEIVGRVFTDYEDTMCHAELIVRVLQLIVTYKILDSENLEKLEKKYQKLFWYFIDIVMPQIKEFLDPNNQLQRQIKEVSMFRFDHIEPKPVMKPLSYDNEKFIHFIETNSLKLAMANFCMNFTGDFVIFTTFKELTDELKGNNILQLWCSDWRIKIVIFADQFDESSRHFEECIKKLDNPDRLNHIFIIFEEHSDIQSNITRKFAKKVEILEKFSFSFTDLTEESKHIVLRKNVIFQGSQTTLDKIIKKDSNASQFLPINHFMESSDPIAIGKLPEKNADYDDKVFIQRKLTSKKGEQVVEFSTEKMDEILELLSREKYIIISDEVGKGKSTLMTHLAYQFLHSSLPHIDGMFFVVKINLHQHSSVLERFSEDTSLGRFIFDNFAKNSDFSEFEWKIFEEFYHDGKIVLMLDGFDEIAPNCERHTFEIIKTILSLKISSLIVATRSLYTQKLNISNAYILSLQSLSFQDQINFLTNYLKSQPSVVKSFSESDITELCTESINRIFRSIKEQYDSKTGAYVNLMMSYPLHLRMFADVIRIKFTENVDNFIDTLTSVKCLNEYYLYDEFFHKKVKIALADKGELVKEELFNLERRGFKRLDLFDCAIKLALNTFHPALKTAPLSITEREKKFLQRYGIVTMQNNEIYFVHRSYAEYLIAYSFLDNLIHGTLMASYFVQDHFLIDILTLVDYQMIKVFIDTAISDDTAYQEISLESHKMLGKFVIKEFEELKGNDKNFLHCIIEHSKKNSIKTGFRKCYVFVSHLLLDSLRFCDSEEDKENIKNILVLPWDENGGSNDSLNIFELVCKLGINCLVSVIFKLAEKVYGNELKDYLFGKYLNDPENGLNPLQLALDQNHLWKDHVFECRVNIKLCLEIEELRELKHTNDENDVDLNEEQNFHQSTIFHLLQLIQTIDFSEEEMLAICPKKSKFFNHYSIYNIFLSLNFYLYYISTFSKIQNKKILNILKLNACYLVAHAIACLHDDVENDTKIILKFLKEKLSNEYKIFIMQFFAVFFESDSVPFHIWPICFMDIKTKIFYLELKESFNNDSKKICEYFQFNPHLTFTMLRSRDHNDISCCLEMYFKTLEDDPLTSLLLNISFQNFNIINHIIANFQMDCINHLLQLLESRFSGKSKLYTIIQRSNMLATSTVTSEKYSRILEFCEINLRKSQTEKLVLMCLHSLSRLYKLKVIKK